MARHEGVHLVSRHIFTKFHVDLIKLTQRIDNFLDAFLNDFAHSFAFVEHRLLLEIANGVAWRQHNFAIKIIFDTGHNAQQGALARAIETEHANFGAVEIREANIT